MRQASDGTGAWGGLFELDLRSLALFRILLGLALLADLYLRLPNLGLHYTDLGVFPRALLFETGLAGRLSLHALAGSDRAIAALFALHAGAALCFVVGYRTRLAGVLCWVGLTSLHARNPFIHMSGDRLLLLLFFWSAFLPLAARAALQPSSVSTSPDSRFRSGATIALVLQIAALYWSTGTAKNGDLWWSGDAVASALRLEELITVPGRWLREQTALLPLLTYSTLAIELAGPVLLFIPRWTWVFRSVAVGLFLGFHLNLALFLDVGLYPVFAAVGWLALIPGELWDRLAARRGPSHLASWLGERLSSDRVREFGWPRASSRAALLAFAAVLPVLVADRLPGVELPRSLRTLVRIPRLDQNWAMFGPNPRITSFVARARGITRRGEWVALELDDSHWVHLVWAILSRDDAATRGARERLVPALCEDWNAGREPDGRLASVRVVVAKTRTRGPVRPPQSLLLAEGACAPAGPSETRR